jgi:DNA-binding MarR family transcriptional regulator
MATMTQSDALTRNDDRPIDDGDYAALAAFRRALRVFTAFSAEAARKAGLTPQQHQALLAIRGCPSKRGLAINEFAEQLLLKPHTAVELADRLEKSGLARRERGEEDRRRVFLTLTAEAEALIEALSRAHLAQIRREAPALIALLGQISAQIER